MKKNRSKKLKMSTNKDQIKNSSKNERNHKETMKNSFYQDIENNGLKYIKQQKQYLIITAIFPIYSIFVQIFNIISVLDRISRPPLKPPINPLLETQIIFNILTPSIILLVISTFAFVKFIFLYMWMRKVHEYEIQTNIQQKILKNTENQEIVRSSITLTQLFYDIVEHMQLIRIIFILLNLVFILYLHWSIGFFLRFYGILTHLIPLPHNIFYILNAVSEFGLILYMGFEWKHFYKWNKKIQHLNKLEKKIYEELNV